MSVKAGDLVYLEEAWEDEAGHSHDEYVTVARVDDKGYFTVRCDNKKIQAWLNKFDWDANDYEAEKQ